MGCSHLEMIPGNRSMGKFVKGVPFAVKRGYTGCRNCTGEVDDGNPC